MSNTRAIVSPTPPPPPLWLVDFAECALRVPLSAKRLAPLPGDAGSRVYYRVSMPKDAPGDAPGDASYIVVYDSSLRQQRVFLRLREKFYAAKARVPRLTAAMEHPDEGAGGLILEDFGDETYYACFNRILADKTDADYRAALDTLVRIQASSALAAEGVLPPYDEKLLRQEMRLFVDWYCERYLRRPLSEKEQAIFYEARRALQREILALPDVPVHRDYHSRNLLLVSGSRARPGPGVVDFQDAVLGSAFYDVVSLLRDAYVPILPREEQARFEYYLSAARRAGLECGELSKDEAWRQYNLCGAQRGLKVLGIFARLYYRDGKHRYMKQLPLVHQYLLDALNALRDVPELAALAKLVKKELSPF